MGPRTNERKNGMKARNITLAASVVAAVSLAALVAVGKTEQTTGKASKTSETSVVTNDNGSVSRSFTECNITTNDNMVTECRRETRTTTDNGGNVLETSTSEYAQSYTIGDGPAPFPSQAATAGKKGKAEAVDTSSFLGLKFGEAYAGTNLVVDANEPTLLRAKFTPKKPLAGFDDYYVYVTPKTHKVAKVYACAKEAIDPGARWRRHYLIEALEKRYDTWARPVGCLRPYYAFDIGSDRRVTVCLAGATPDYETVLCAKDFNALNAAAEEYEEVRKEALKRAADERKSRVESAVDAF